MPPEGSSEKAEETTGAAEQVAGSSSRGAQAREKMPERAKLKVCPAKLLRQQSSRNRRRGWDELIGLAHEGGKLGVVAEGKVATKNRFAPEKAPSSEGSPSHPVVGGKRLDCRDAPETAALGRRKGVLLGVPMSFHRDLW